METSTFVLDQMAAAITDTAARLASLPQGRLSDDHPVAKHLVDDLTIAMLIGHLSICEHASTSVPTMHRWSPGIPELSCYLCWIAFTATNHSALCDVCGSRRPLGQVSIAVGPVAVVAAVCDLCLVLRFRDGGAVTEVRRARERITDYLLAQIVEVP